MHDVKSEKRRYQMGARAEAASATKSRILASARELVMDNTFDTLTLEAVAAGAETTVRTVLRAFESKELLFAATLDTLGDRGFGPVHPGDVDRTIHTLFGFYERFGDTVIRWLADEPRVPALRDHLEVGREHLRSWVSESFASTLKSIGDSERPQVLDALIVPLDVYTWKLLRRDFGLGRRAAQAVVRRMLIALT